MAPGQELDSPEASRRARRTIWNSLGTARSSGEFKSGLGAPRSGGRCTTEILSPEFEGAGIDIQRDILPLVGR